MDIESQADAPKVSVVINARNHAKHIAQAIDSILSQGFQDFEIIVTDGASTDGSPEVVRAFDDARVKLETLPVERGPSASMNAALARAAGVYVAILDPNDFALPGRLAQQVEQLDAHPEVGAVFTPARVASATSEPVEPPEFNAPATISDQDRAAWLRHVFFNGDVLCASSAMVRRAALDQVGAYDPRLTALGNLDMWVRLTQDWDIAFVREPLTAIRTRPEAGEVTAPEARAAKLRSAFEYATILRRYRDMKLPLFREAFAQELTGRLLETDLDKLRWLADAALWKNTPPHRLFGLQTYFDLACEDWDYRRLKDVTGRIDLFGLTGASSLLDLPVVDRPCLITDTGVILPERNGGRARFLVPATTREIYLASPRIRREGDARLLGVVVRGLAVDDGSGVMKPIDLAHPDFQQGFHPLERRETAQWRWTDGYGRLPLTVLPRGGGYFLLEVTGDFEPTLRKT